MCDDGYCEDSYEELKAAPEPALGESAASQANAGLVRSPAADSFGGEQEWDLPPEAADARHWSVLNVGSPTSLGRGSKRGFLRMSSSGIVPPEAEYPGGLPPATDEDKKTCGCCSIQ